MLSNRKDGGFPPECVQQGELHIGGKCNIHLNNTMFCLSCLFIFYALISQLISSLVNLKTHVQTGLDLFSFVLTIVSLAMSAGTMSDVVGATKDSVAHPIPAHLAHKLLENMLDDFVRKLVFLVMAVAVYGVFAIIFVSLATAGSFATLVDPDPLTSDQVLALLLQALQNATVGR